MPSLNLACRIFLFLNVFATSEVDAEAIQMIGAGVAQVTSEFEPSTSFECTADETLFHASVDPGSLVFSQELFSSVFNLGPSGERGSVIVMRGTDSQSQTLPTSPRPGTTPPTGFIEFHDGRPNLSFSADMVGCAGIGTIRVIQVNSSLSGEVSLYWLDHSLSHEEATRRDDAEMSLTLTTQLLASTQRQELFPASEITGLDGEEEMLATLQLYISDQSLTAIAISGAGQMDVSAEISLKIFLVGQNFGVTQ